MQDLTISVDDDVLAAAEAVAEKHETTVGDLVRSYLAGLGRGGRGVEGRKELLALMDTSTGQLDPGFKWNREDIYVERIERLLSRHEHSGLRGPPRSE